MSDDDSSGQGRLLTLVSVAALAVVVIAPAAASWHGLVETGRDIIGLSGGWEYLVPLTLDGAALYAATLAMRSILAGDSAFGARLLTALYALAAASFQFHHARTAVDGNLAAALFFAGASLSSVVLWDVTLRALRRGDLRKKGLIEEPLPRWRLLRWLVAPLETAKAWRLAVIEQITDPSEALRMVRTEKTAPRSVTAERITDDPAPTDHAAIEEGTTDEQDDTDSGQEWRYGLLQSAADGGSGLVRDHRANTSSEHGKRSPGLAEASSDSIGDVRELADGPATVVTDVAQAQTEALREDRDRDALRKLNKAQAVRWAFERIGERDIPTALAFLAERGVKVDRSYAYTIDYQPPQPPALSVVGTDQR